MYMTAQFPVLGQAQSSRVKLVLWAKTSKCLKKKKKKLLSNQITPFCHLKFKRLPLSLI
jgi:hypothetical protein